MSDARQARGIDMSFRGGDELTRVLRGVDMSLQSGELAALLGASGSSKSTLLSIIDLLLKPTAGCITIAGQQVDTLSEAERARFRNQKLVGMADPMDFPATRLSGGHEQRVAIARVVMNNPALILADEPTGSLDRVSADKALDLMEGVNREHKGSRQAAFPVLASVI